MPRHKKASKFQNAKPTQIQSGEAVLEYVNFVDKLLSTAEPNRALVREACACCGLPGTMLRGEIQWDESMTLHSIGSSVGYSLCSGTWKYSNLQRKGLSMDFLIIRIYLERKVRKSPVGQTESRLSSAQYRHCSAFILMEETPMTQTLLNNWLFASHLRCIIHSMKWALNNLLFETEQLS